MSTRILPSADEDLSVEAEFDVTSACRTLEHAGLIGAGIDMVI